LGGGGDGALKLRVGRSPNPMHLGRWFQKLPVGTRSHHNICLHGARQRAVAGWHCRLMRRRRCLCRWLPPRANLTRRVELLIVDRSWSRSEVTGTSPSPGHRAN